MVVHPSIFIVYTTTYIARDGDNMIESMYNISHRYKGKYYIYNTLTRALIEFDDKDEYEAILQSPDSVDHHHQYQILVDKGIIVRSHSDETIQCRAIENNVRYRGNRVTMSVMVTKQCNFRCKYCFETHEDVTIDCQAIDRIERYLRRVLHRGSVFILSWYGGEPLVAFDQMVELNKRIRPIVDEYDIDYYSRIATNGYALDNEMIPILINDMRLKIVSITLDGPKENHNYARPHVDGSGTYEKILENIVTLDNYCGQNSANDVKILIRINVSDLNRPHIAEFVAGLPEQLRNERVVINAHPVHQFSEINRGYSRHLIESSDTYRDAGSVKHQLHDIMETYGFYREGEEKLKLWRLGLYCGVECIYSSVVGPRAELYKCGTMVESKDVIGHIDANGVMQYDFDRLKVWLQDSSPECATCIRRPICSGGCRTRSMAEEGCCGLTDTRLRIELENKIENRPVTSAYTYLFREFDEDRCKGGTSSL